MRVLFKDRYEAGIRLSHQLEQFKKFQPTILALPRGGVVVGFAAARSMGLNLDVVLVRKLALPLNPEYGLGALSEDKIPYFNPDLSMFSDFSSQEMKRVITHEQRELERRKLVYREGREIAVKENSYLIVIDDGVATGVTAAAAGRYLRSFHPEKLILAVPVAPKKIPHFLNDFYDEIISLYKMENFRGVGEWYENFPQVDDHEVLTCLGKGSLFEATSL